MDFKFNDKELSIYSVDIKSREIYNNGRIIGQKISILDLEDKKNKIEFNIIIDSHNSKDKKCKFKEKTYVEIMEILDAIYDNDMSIDNIVITSVKGDLNRLEYSKDGENVVVEAL